MRYTVIYTRRFKRTLKRVRRAPGFRAERLKQVIAMLAADARLPAVYKDHKLRGRLKEFRECHLAPDILLIYQKDDDALVLVLVAIGSHAHLLD